MTSTPSFGPSAERAARYITRGAEEMAAKASSTSIRQLFGWSMWAALHGIVMLHQSGYADPTGRTTESLAYFIGLTMMKGAGAKFGPGGIAQPRRARSDDSRA